MLLLVGTAQCNREPEPVTVTFKIEGEVDGQAITYDQIQYTNEAGEKYSVEKCEFYLSDIQLVRDDDSTYGDRKATYFSLRDGRTSTFIYKVPVGTYKAVRFVFGVAPAYNTTGQLPNHPENINMAWPDMMGGGYHHMKLEGKYTAGGDTATYATHMGDLVKDGQRYVTSFAVELPLANETINAERRTVVVSMNLNEWYRNPHTYSFAHFHANGSGIMGNPTALITLKENGVDVFSVKRVE